MHRRNETILKDLNYKLSFLESIRQEKLRYYGHTMRMEGDCLEKLVMQGKVKDTRGRGRP